MRNKKRFWKRNKRLSDLYRARESLRIKLTPPSARTLTGIGRIYAKLFKDSRHIISQKDKLRYDKIESLIHEMKEHIIG